jgi:hypothetical protein
LAGGAHPARCRSRDAIRAPAAFPLPPGPNTIRQGCSGTSAVNPLESSRDGA